MSQQTGNKSKITVCIILSVILVGVITAYAVISNVSKSDADKKDTDNNLVLATKNPDISLVPAKDSASPTIEASKKPAVTSEPAKATKVTSTTKAPTKAPDKNVTKKPDATKVATKQPASTKSPTKKPAVAPTKAPTKKPAASKKPAKTATPVTGDISGISNEEIDAYYSDAVFIGDSVMYGFDLYCMRKGNGFLGNPTFLAAGSFSARNALKPVTARSTHPKYKGEKRLLWDSIAMIKPKRVFFFFGINDLGINGVNGTYDNYLTVIDKILAVDPTIEVHIVSTTPMYKGSEKGRLNNHNIDVLNAKMRGYCKDTGASYFDIATYLKDEDGTIKREYSSDRYVHETTSAYKLWEAKLREYAAVKILEKKEAQATKKPAATKAPATTKAPTTSKPAATTKAPATTSKPAATTKVPTTSKPAATQEVATKAPTTEAEEI